MALRNDSINLTSAEVSGLGNSATRNVGSTSGTVAAGDDTRLNTVEGKSGGSISGNVTVTGRVTIDSPSAQGASNFRFTDTGGSLQLNSNVDQTENGPRRIYRVTSPENKVFLEVNGAFRCRPGIDSSGSNQNNGFNINWVNGNGAHLWIDRLNTGAINTTPVSDKFLKKNIQYRNDTERALEEVSRWKVATFKYKARGIMPESDNKLGFIAQDLAEVSPETVDGEGLESDDYDDNDPKGAYSLDQVALIAKLTQAVQALTQRVKDLELSKEE
ncbi:tail fiber domain-containing protein [Leclercia adecarboxylata]|uniref:tail fiber domain-containing protein n=1 Tax=Leclercia adecarboxylata TaxID=83655 RepID=UPI001243F0D3|nr:tail fiber domain-containing protein [Leclercia adecarboxylata]QEY55160.1 tail fiber domain-containing protein [Leclercia adecarboxylata]